MSKEIEPIDPLDDDDLFIAMIKEDCRSSLISSDEFERKLADLVLTSLSDRLSDCGCIVTLFSFLLEAEQRGELERVCHVLSQIFPSIMKPERYQQLN